MTPAIPRALIMSLAIASAAACRESRSGDAATAAGNLPQSRPRVGIGRTFSMGLLDYEIARVTAVRGMPTRGRVVAPSEGSVWVIVEYRRSWRGESVLVVPAMPFELVTRNGQRIAGDVDGLSAQIERTNCGELGPSRLRPLVDERNCEVFAVPIAQLEGATLEPAPALHRGPFPRAIVELGVLAVSAAP